MGWWFSDVVYGVWIGGVVCELLFDRYMVLEEIVCVMGLVLGLFLDIVIVNVFKEGKFWDCFFYVLFLVYFLEFFMGFKVGGIRIIIYGNDFYVGFEF